MCDKVTVFMDCSSWEGNRVAREHACTKMKLQQTDQTLLTGERFKPDASVKVQVQWTDNDCIL